MSSEGTDKRGKLWAIAAIVGVLAFLALKLLANYSFWPALLLAILIGILVAILLWIGFYRDAEEEGAGLGAASPPPAKTTSAPEAAGLVSKATAAPAKKAPAKKSQGKKSPAKPKAKAAVKPKAATAKPATKKTAAAKKTSAKPVAKDGKPPLLKKARASGADDLKRIKGVGPGLEKTLNELGFYHFDQVAAWRKQEIEWVDSRLKFKGRIVRDDWVKQTKTLAKGSK